MFDLEQVVVLALPLLRHASSDLVVDEMEWKGEIPLKSFLIFISNILILWNLYYLYETVLQKIK